jgi:hypothetical protein
MPRLMGVVVELTEPARMPSQQTILAIQPLTRSALHAAHTVRTRRDGQRWVVEP